VQYYDNRAKKASTPFKWCNRPSDVAVAVNFNAEFNLMPGNPIIECFSKDLVHEY
jgi:hypothetical protein